MTAQPQAAGIRTALYLRISKDAEGKGLGVGRQEETSRALALARGWDVDDDLVFVENDTSASSEKKRPKFEALLRGMASGEIKGVIAYRVDRLVRRLDDLSRLMDTAQKHGVLVATVSGDLDLASAQGRAFATIVGALAAIEVDATSERIRARNASARQKGQVTNGGSRPYGWQLDRRRHHKAEAQVVRDVADRLILGESLSGIARSLNRAGVKTAYGNRWDVKNLRQVMSSPRHAGRLSHAGKVVTGADGRPVVGDFPPILSPEVFDQVQVALEARSVISDRWTGARRHLLSGSLSACGVCGQGLLPFQGTNTAWTYRCRGHLARNRDRTDEYVLQQVREYALEHPIRVESWAMEERVDLSEQIAELERRLADMEEQFVSSGGDAGRFARVTAAIEAQLDALRAERTDRLALQTSVQFAQFDLTSLLAESASLLPQATDEESDAKARAIDEQRAALRLYVDRVVISPTRVRGNRFDTDSLRVEFKDPDRLQWRAVVEA